MSYADMVLGGGEPPKPAATDYAGEILGGAPAPKKEPVIDDPSKAARVGTIAAASFGTDPEAVLSYFAREMKMPRERFSIQDGEYVYRGDDGNLYNIIPSSDIRKPLSLLQRGAAEIGPAMAPIASGTAGMVTAPMMLTGPGGMAASLTATGAAGAGAEGLRQFLAKKLMGQDVDVGRIAGEGALGAAGQGVGGGLTALAQRGVARDVAKLNRPQMADLESRAARFGIQLTPAETSGLASLRAQQKALGNLPSSSDTMEQFYTRRSGTIKTAVNRLLDDVSPIDSAEVAGAMTRDAANLRIGAAVNSRERVASPLYKNAFATGAEVDTKPLLDALDTELKFAKGSIKTALERVKGYLMREVEDVADDGSIVKRIVPDSSLEGLHNAKMAIDELIENAKENSIGRTGKRKLLDAQDALLQMMDDASPEYRLARETFEAKSIPVNALKEGIVGIIGDLPNTRLQTMASKIFDPASSGPLAVREAKDAISSANPKAWQAIKRAWLQQQWEKAGREFVSTGSNVVNQGPKFRALVLGDDNRRKMIQAALSPNEWKALNELADVLEAAGRVKPLGSDTAWNQEMNKLAREQATPLVAKLARVFRPQDWGRLMEEWATERGLAKNVEKVADIITQPGAAEKLKQIRMLSHNGARFRASLAHFMTQTGAFALGAPPPDTPSVPIR